MLGEKLLEKNLIPDFLVRSRIRSLLKERLKLEERADPSSFIKAISAAPIAVNTSEANSQHYEVPARFFELALGPNLKYSCAYFATEGVTLGDAEAKMLQMSTERAGLENGQQVLELGCGWGSLSLWMAEKFPASRITSVSNSRSQKAFIDQRARERKLTNLNVITADMNEFSTHQQFDRIVSVEMFEHMRNVPALFEKVSKFLKPDGKLFVHIFSHVKYAYLFETKDDSDWMARHFFTGGMMPSDWLYSRFQKDLKLERQWIVNGVHYQKTAEAWLKNMDNNRSEVLTLFAQTYGPKEARKWFAYWRVFFMSCAELWGYRNGEEWHVTHYLFGKKQEPIV